MSVDLEQIWEIFDTSRKEQEQEKETIEKKCCKKFYLVANQGYQTCVNCGTVCETTVVDSDIFSFENGPDNKYLRQFDSHLFPKGSIATKISGNSRISMIQNWDSMPYNERMLLEVSNNLKSMLSLKFSPRIVNDTLVLYKKFYEDSGIHRGSNKKGFVAVCLYIASSNNFASITPDEVSEILDIDVKIFHKCLQRYSEITGTKLGTSGKAYIEAFINKLGLPFKIRKPAVKIIEYVEKTGIIGCALPQNSCISVLLFVSKEMGISIDKTLVSKEFNISITTIDKNLGVLVVNKQRIFNALKKSS